MILLYNYIWGLKCNYIIKLLCLTGICILLLLRGSIQRKAKCIRLDFVGSIVVQESTLHVWPFHLSWFEYSVHYQCLNHAIFAALLSHTSLHIQIFFSASCPKALCLFYSLHIRYKASQPHRTLNKSIHFILNFMFLGGSLRTNMSEINP